MTHAQENAESVGEQVKNVASETAGQARDLWHEGRQQLAEQVRQGQRKAANGLHTLADQLDQMYDGSDESDFGQKVVRQAAEQTRQAASWLERRRPGDLLDEVRTFARRNPGVFLAGAALAGVLVGRITRGVVASQEDGDKPEEPAPQPDPPSFVRGRLDAGTSRYRQRRILGMSARKYTLSTSTTSRLVTTSTGNRPWP
ncbi:hypothetical protein GCM10029964_083110 [Kibdelosporangium lantanae]